VRGEGTHSKCLGWVRCVALKCCEGSVGQVAAVAWLSGYWAHVEGLVLGVLAAMRAVWEETVKGPLGR
jgi:hypothetical protein